MGTRGVPARYGGFETAVEEIGSRLAERGYDVTVYCRNPGQKQREHLGMRLVNLPAIRHRMAETLSHTGVSAGHAILRDRPDVALLLNAGNAPWLRPLSLAGIPTAIHLDGLESRRQKWRGVGARYYQWAERAAVAWGTEVIADAEAIARHVHANYGRTCVVIPYGASVIFPESDRLAELDCVPGGYHLIVARFEPENHVLEAVEGYRRSAQAQPLIVVGDAPYSQDYIARVRHVADDPRIRLVGSVYDAALLDQLYGHAITYVHGHSVGGTNPSLLRAMGAGAAVLAYEVEFNREVTAGQALFWSGSDDLADLFTSIASGRSAELDQLRAAGRERIEQHYRWDDVVDRYEDLIHRLKARRR